MSAVGLMFWSIVHGVLTVIGPVYLWLIKNILALIYNPSATSVPAITDPILLNSATELAQKIRSKKLTSVQVMQAYIARVRLVNPITNAVVNDRFEAALAEAKKVDEILANDTINEKYSEVNMPFLGVPISIKECFYFAGYPCTTGMVERRDHISSEDAPIVTRLKDAGLIPFVFTNVSELCMWYESSNYLYGTTRNAYDTSRIVGGSSGGEACNISAAGSVIGVGSDIGGSLRMPAFFNGVFSHKTTYGIVPNEGQHPPLEGPGIDDSILSTGPICRYASDIIPLLTVMAGPGVSKLKLGEKVDFKQMTFFTMDNMDGAAMVSRVDSELKEAQKRAANHFAEKFGSRVHTIRLSRAKYLLEMWMAEMDATGGKPFCHYLGNETCELNAYLELIKWFMRLSNHTLAAIGLAIVERFKLSDQDRTKLLEMSAGLRVELTNLLLNDGVFLFPSHPRTAPYHNMPLFMPFDFAFTAAFNALKLPATQCPLGLNASGLPLGVQVVAAPFNDHLTIAVARELESVFGGWTPPRSRE